LISVTPMNAAIRLSCIVIRSGAVNLESELTSLTTTVSPRRYASLNAAPNVPRPPRSTSDGTPDAYSARMTYSPASISA
jgi:hypothetical protein